MAGLGQAAGIGRGALSRSRRGPLAAVASLRPLLASLTAGVICGLLVVVSRSLTRRCCSNGALSGYVAVGIGLCLFSSAVLAAVIAFGSSHPA